MRARWFGYVRLVFCLLIAGISMGPAMGDSSHGDASTPRDPDARRLGEMFCAARIGGDMRPILPYIDPRLRKVSLIAIGDFLWQGRPAARPTSCTIDIVNGFDRTIEVLVRITYLAPRETWSDIINLERTPTGWVITNLFYETGGNLRFRMFEGGYDSYFG
jgi:hypothetical protein